MTLPEFQEYVEEHPESFEGVHPETQASLEAAEKALGLSLPESFKWLLGRWGYSDGSAIDSLDEAVRLTLSCRENRGLPGNYIVLNDWQDAGVVWTDRNEASADGESPIYWSEEHNFLRLGTDMPLGENVDVFEDYPAWCRSHAEDPL